MEYPTLVFHFDAESNLVTCLYKTGPTSYEVISQMTLLDYQITFGLASARWLLRG